ncbi:MAG: site-specific integrase [Ardenticatenaceae bacterium]|nr:site-specific integrase [Ardenticatenaceae bacterium]
MATAIVASRQAALSAPEITDTRLLQLWLHGRLPRTQRAYRTDAARFLVFAGKRLQHATLADLQAFADSRADLAPASQARTLAAIKSLFIFAHKAGYLPVNVGAASNEERRQALLEAVGGQGQSSATAAYATVGSSPDNQ